MSIKFIVLIFCFKEVVLHQLKYCEICKNHTLCKFKKPGPSKTCVGYDKNALLTERDMQDILNRINNRRNFIAMQNLKHLPGAANMKKMEWSSELAVMAQRWADQCDPSIFPDKKDQCRDTDNFKVGQNIATISGLTPGVNVKSFIDIWFIESLEYIGTVSYYNQSRDNKTNHFTQIIWAETDKVGCGKVRFYVDNLRYILIERLVCNFAPKGNIHGKPIYVIGYPSTQCAPNMFPDPVFSGLCSYKAGRKAQHTELNLQDFYFRRYILPSSLKNGQNNICGINDTQCKNENQNVQDVKDSFVAVKRSHTDSNVQWIDPNASRNFEHHQQDKGHSRVYNNHNHKLEFDSIHPNVNQDWRKYDALISSVAPLLIQEYRRQNLGKKCTRKYGTECNDNSSTENKLCKEKSIQCTRDQRKLCRDNTFPTLQNLCPCNTQKIQYSSTPSYQNTCGTNMLKSLVISRNNNIMAKRNNFSAGLHLSDFQKNYENKADFEEYLSQSQEDSSSSKPFTRKYVSFDNIDFEHNYSERLRRETEEAYTVKPFWQMDELITKNQFQLKGMRYTTITNKKNKKNSKVPKTSKTTEFITISKYLPVKEKSLTEKYLSFDELLHLRKFNTNNYNFRRQGKSANQTTSTETPRTENTTMPEYTANTPFKRMKHCTRKLTCTWTVALLTDSGGHPRNANGDVNQHTPPGYVEGCTRTSTCTRDFMYRNKMPTLATDFTYTDLTTDSSANGDEEDYCERRSLNKRDLFKKVISKINNERKFINDATPFTPNEDQNKKKQIRGYKNTNIFDGNKRSYRNARKKIKDKSIISYGNLYYLIVQRLVESWKKNRKLFPNKKCLCSSSNKIEYRIYLFIFVSASYITR